MIALALNALHNPRYDNDGIIRKYKSRDTSDEPPPPDTLSAEGSPNRSANRPDENRANRVEDGDAPHISVPNYDSTNSSFVIQTAHFHLEAFDP